MKARKIIKPASVALVGILLMGLFIYLFNFVLPVFIRMDDSFDLGNGYRYTPDSPQAIVNETGGIAAEGYLYYYNYDDTYIVAVTKKRERGEPFIYWIINKQTREYLHFSDSIEMIQQKNKLGILLNLRPCPLLTH